MLEGISSTSMHFNWEKEKLETPSLKECNETQGKETFFQQAAEQIGQTGTTFSLANHDVMLRQAPIDGALQKLVPQSLRQRIPYNSHHSPFPIHPGQLRMYDTMRRDYYWPNIVQDEYHTVSDSHSCAKHGTRQMHVQTPPSTISVNRTFGICRNGYLGISHQDDQRKTICCCK